MNNRERVRERLDRAFDEATEKDVSVQYVDWLPDGWHGAYSDADRNILIRDGIQRRYPVLHACVLWHELGHAEYNHVGQVAEQERMADRFAAKQLVRLDNWTEARRRGGSDAATAAYLGVEEWVVRAYKRTINGGLFARVGTGLYQGEPTGVPRLMESPLTYILCNPR